MFLFVGFAEFLAFVLLQTDAKPGKHDHSIGSNVGETERSCELEFGSYCLWSKEHREVMRDSVVKRLKDQLFVARAYYPSIAKLQGQENLTRELKLNIQDHERILSEAVSDPDLPPQVPDDTVKNAAVLHYDGNMKPWLDLGIPKYKKYWKKYLTQEERFMDECNVNP
ncbi:hypothetical protein BHE74_00037192 [Ensete ventricosum]|nr:hypothetical protein GW17_00024672 [Ensete ventricosum]RWW56114.1 hypothetical protein BHE74_00037192 [Ensete ventricosum]RZS14455.1 hypothetical protein BHM03_00046146 [Ensete ventricosum]